MRTKPLHILIAPNAFKNSLTAAAAADAILTGLNRSGLSCTGERFPVADGGDGTGALLVERLGGKWMSCNVHDPLGRPVTAAFGLIDGGRTAVIEMADASGIRLLGPDELSPLTATSYGTGELVRAALDSGAREIILGVGGSATVDGGAGILRALGVRFLDRDGRALSATPESLASLDHLDLLELDQRIAQCRITVLCDVGNELLGADGAAAVFGPQKGAGPADVERLDASLRQLADVVFRQTGRRIGAVKHGGAAGGIAAGLYGLLDVQLVNGIDLFLQLTGFEERLEKADLVITGEGSIDDQTLQGKGPYGVASRAKQRGIPVIGLAGRVPLSPGDGLRAYFDMLLAIGNEPAALPEALARTRENLERVAEEIGRIWKVFV
jgi:glycerate kinase